MSALRCVLALLISLLLVRPCLPEPPWAPPPAVASLLEKRALPESPGYTLADLLALQKRSYPAAAVTSGFLDPRGISRYRSQPGLHLGYDIAMPYGSQVYCAWPGTVEAIVPWHGEEVGVRIRHRDGTCATYGHVRALVQVGQEVEAGDAIATIASDHLDVKMRDARGEPLDFGQEKAAATLYQQWMQACSRWLSLQARLGELRQSLARRQNPPRPSREAIPAYLEAGLLSLQQARRLEIRHRQFEQAASRRAQAQTELASLERQLEQAARECSALYQRATRAGYTWSDAARYLSGST